MSVPPLHLSNTFDSYISGEVIIHPSAVLAPGVILQAVPNSKIIIGPGVCIGMGSILQVNEGTLEVEAGASLGSGFLMVGQGKIGANACIGSATTVFNCSVDPGQVVAPGSILGDTSRRVVATDDLTDVTNSATVELTDQVSVTSTNSSADPLSHTLNGQTHADAQVLANAANVTNATPPPTVTPDPDSEKPAIGTSESSCQSRDPPTVQPPQQLPAPSTESQNNSITHIYGQQNIQRLLLTLFPHRQSSSKPTSDEPTE